MHNSLNLKERALDSDTCSKDQAKAVSESEGYVYTAYGKLKYLKHAVASVYSLKKYDDKRPVALICDQKLHKYVETFQLAQLFDRICTLKPQHRSIPGFKHNLHEYMVFEKNLYLDSDIIWCKKPDPLWKRFAAHQYTTTGNLTADPFFGSHKDIEVIVDLIWNRRKKTLDKFGLSHLSRVQAGMMFCQDYTITKKVNTLAKSYLSKIDETHFRSRKQEQGRNEESCEWSLAMAMSELGLTVTPWHWGAESPQIVYVGEIVEHDDEFTQVTCTYFTDRFMDNLKGIQKDWLRTCIRTLTGLLPGKKDHMFITPYSLHFGFYHEKKPFHAYADKVWNRLIKLNMKEKMTEKVPDAI